MNDRHDAQTVMTTEADPYSDRQTQQRLRLHGLIQTIRDVSCVDAAQPYLTLAWHREPDVVTRQRHHERSLHQNDRPSTHARSYEYHQPSRCYW